MMNFSKTAEEVIDLINQIRNQPKSIITQLKSRLDHFHGTTLKIPNAKSIETDEGAFALEECIEFLESCKPLHQLEIEPMISKSCQDHIVDSYVNEIHDHIGSDGSYPMARLGRYGFTSGDVSESSVFGKSEAFEIVYDLIVDDGNFSRSNRKNVFNSKFSYIGVACGPHTIKKSLCVIMFSNNFIKKREESSSLTSSNSTPLKQVIKREKINLEFRNPSPPKSNLTNISNGKRIIKIKKMPDFFSTFSPQKPINPKSSLSNGREIIKVVGRDISPPKKQISTMNSSFDNLSISAITMFPSRKSSFSTTPNFQRKYIKIGAL